VLQFSIVGIDEGVRKRCPKRSGERHFMLRQLLPCSGNLTTNLLVWCLEISELNSGVPCSTYVPYSLGVSLTALPSDVRLGYALPLDLS
jgi:hypothetical protein